MTPDSMGKWMMIGLMALALMACQQTVQSQPPAVYTGADQTALYLPLFKDKKVGLFVNHTALIGTTHLTDSLLAARVQVVAVFTPEHGFLGNKSDGELISDEKTKAPFRLISLYGSNKKPLDEDIQALDVLVVDIQDVGVRCYTYASTMTYLMEACAKNNIPVIVLDRPNPNGHLVDGPVLEPAFKSFVGLHPIPLAHGLTLGELALMINGEGWLEDSIQCALTVIPAKNWSHKHPYSLPVSPSPNLPNTQAVTNYPSLVLFEGTVVSVGRGTTLPFQQVGHPKYTDTTYSFVPQPTSASKYPPLQGQLCYGQQVQMARAQQLDLARLIHFYQQTTSNGTDTFFNDYFEKLAGTAQLREQIIKGASESAIRESWKESLEAYHLLRKKYLLYPD